MGGKKISFIFWVLAPVVKCICVVGTDRESSCVVIDSAVILSKLVVAKASVEIRFEVGCIKGNGTRIISDSSNEVPALADADDHAY